MLQITFVSADGKRTAVTGDSGQSVMEVAVNNGISGIVAECGGAMMCSTCHVYIDADANEFFAVRSETEEEMLDMTASERTEQSRLSCQLILEADTPDFIVRLPTTQI